MSVKKEASGRRSVQVEVEVPGTPEEVWQAIATGPGISAWFVPAEFEERDGRIWVREKLEPTARPTRAPAQAGPESIFIIGGGAAGNAAASQHGFPCARGKPLSLWRASFGTFGRRRSADHGRCRG